MKLKDGVFFAATEVCRVLRHVVSIQTRQKETGSRAITWSTWFREKRSYQHCCASHFGKTLREGTSWSWNCGLENIDPSEVRCFKIKRYWLLFMPLFTLIWFYCVLMVNMKNHTFSEQLTAKIIKLRWNKKALAVLKSRDYLDLNYLWNIWHRHFGVFLCENKTQIQTLCSVYSSLVM